MRKTLLAILLLASVGLLNAVDLNGRIGMGMGWSPDGQTTIGTSVFPLADIAVTRIGLSEKLSVEPIFQFTLSNANDATGYYFKLYGLGNFLLKGHSKTNLYAKAGLGFTMDKPAGVDESTISFGLPFGFGIEHFCSEHFSINLAAHSGIFFVTEPSSFQVRLGNDKPFAFYLMWYY
jgi:hypothetical protein